MVFQSYALYPHKTVRGNLAFYRLMGSVWDLGDALKEQGYELEGPDAASEGREALKETGYELQPDSSMEDSRAALRDFQRDDHGGGRWDGGRRHRRAPVDTGIYFCPHWANRRCWRSNRGN